MVMAKALPDRERGVCCSIELEVPQARAEELATVLKALADPTRVQMILSLRQAKEPICICDFTATFSLSQPTVSHHVAKLLVLFGERWNRAARGTASGSCLGGEIRQGRNRTALRGPGGVVGRRGRADRDYQDMRGM